MRGGVPIRVLVMSLRRREIGKEVPEINMTTKYENWTRRRDSEVELHGVRSR